MSDITKAGHKVVLREEFEAARQALLKEEKEWTRRGDELARKRRELPWVRMEKEYQFETATGEASLAELFKGRSQLIVYHFMFGPDYSAGCPACSATADAFNGLLPHLEARDVTMICVSLAPVEKLLAYRKRMGWSFNWVSSGKNDFNFDFGVTAGKSSSGRPEKFVAGEVAVVPMLSDPEFRKKMPPVAQQNAETSGTDLVGYLSQGHGVSVFAREGDSVYHCYTSYDRGTEFLMSFYAVLDRVPKGRDEDGPMGKWLHRHDEYETEVKTSAPCCGG